MSDKRKVGQIGEEAAEKHLKAADYLILSANYQSGTGESAGEIDIIAFKKGCLVFVEVKTRSDNSYGEPIDSVDIRKMKAIIRTSASFENDYVKKDSIYAHIPFLFFRLRKRLKITKRRFDIIEVMLSRSGSVENIKHHENAFIAATPTRLEKKRTNERKRF